jgi:ATP-dependent RNA helicase DDX54/DBP10
MSLNNNDLFFDSAKPNDQDEEKTTFQGKKKVKGGSFESFNLSSDVYKAIKKKGYNMPTPIQRKAIPVIMEGFNIIAMARTGSGKTGAFVIPVVERLKAHSKIVGARCLILSPTREIAM